LIFTFLDTSTAVPDSRAISSAAIPDQAISADGLDNTCGDIQATIQEGRALLQEVSGGYTGVEDDAVMGDETAHKKRSKDDIYDKNYVDPDF
jgi:hypothetical protein